ncbi:MAG TPA: arylsulfotransferase family protein [Solirubrobacteraceae bacterium]|jgi:outer membrane protein assembly factor BamB|nr:arylsulfotransferase family protein [Solirubrobacteraceae bacterium]
MNHLKRSAVLVSITAFLAVVSAPGNAGATVAVRISPLPGTPTAMAQTQISFLGASPSALSAISVVGTRSGRHRGRLRSYAAATGASFVPSRPFVPNEHVTVSAQWHDGSRTVTLSTHFKVAQPVAVSMTGFPATPGTPAEVQSFNSQPSLHPPTVVVHQPAGATSAPGYIFAAPFLGPGQYGPMIFDSSGNLVWFHPVAAGEDAADFQTQVYHGKNDLTWWQGRTIALGYGLGQDVIADANYRTVAVVRAGNGLQADEHEFDLTPQGTAYILAYSPVQTNLTAAGGSAHGVAVEGVIQEIDIHTGLVMWEWHSLAHVGVAQSYSKPSAIASTPFDYFHINSLAVDTQGNLLISARNTWTLYDLDSHSGQVIWRLGGRSSSFTLGPSVAFAYQHNAAWLPDGQISLFDDEGAPPVNPPSRGEIITLDQHTKTATLAAQLLRSSGPLATASQGDVQALPGGGWMVGWGGLPNFTEFDAQGQIVYDAQLPAGENSYRVYRLPWAAQPLEPPALAAVTSGATTTAYASWNGATTVASWQLLSGSSATTLTPVATVARSGFETAIAVPSAPLVEVRALSASGKVIGTSKALAPSAG